MATEAYKIILDASAKSDRPPTTGTEPTAKLPPLSKKEQREPEKEVAGIGAGVMIAAAQASKIVNSVVATQKNTELSQMVQATTSIGLKAMTVVGGVIIGGAGNLLAGGALLSSAVDLGLELYQNDITRQVLNTEQQFNIRRLGYISRGRQK